MAAGKIYVTVLKLHKNRIEESNALTEHLRWAQGAMHELHLSHNRLPTAAVQSLVLAACVAVGKYGRWAYPSGGTPLWLRTEQNLVQAQALEASLQKDLQKAGRPSASAICAVDGKSRCRAGWCHRLADPPAVHLT